MEPHFLRLIFGTQTYTGGHLDETVTGRREIIGDNFSDNNFRLCFPNFAALAAFKPALLLIARSSGDSVPVNWPFNTRFIPLGHFFTDFGHKTTGGFIGTQM
jgi:hypothetical protein